jgi:iron(III) transport system ATP-binding protein
VRLPAPRPAPGGPASGLKPGDDALLAIRPAGVLLLPSAAEAAHLTGRVADVAFRGRGYEYAVDLPGLGRLTGVLASHRAARGEPVGMRLNPRGCHLFAAQAAVPAPDGAGSPAPALTA